MLWRIFLLGVALVLSCAPQVQPSKLPAPKKTVAPAPVAGPTSPSPAASVPVRQLPKPGQPLRVVTVEEVVKRESGGTQSVASIAIVEGEKRFLRSAQAVQRRYANLESDLLAYELFSLLDLPAPHAEIVKLAPDSPLRDYLGEVVMSMEFVEAGFAGCAQIRKASPRLPNTAVERDFRKMLLVDILTGNGDRVGSNYFYRVDQQKAISPVPIDNNSGFGNLLTWEANIHCNFVKTYEPIGKVPGLRFCGSIPSVLAASNLQNQLLSTPSERAEMLELADLMVAKLSDDKLALMVDRLPDEIIPPGTTLPALSTLSAPGLSPEVLKVLANGYQEGASGKRLLQLRRQQLKETLTWRRDHLRGALQTFFDQLDQGRDPIEECRQDWAVREDPGDMNNL